VVDIYFVNHRGRIYGKGRDNEISNLANRPVKLAICRIRLCSFVIARTQFM
jgi:hypothetical protein